MTSIAQGVARTFAHFEALDGYRLDILGSLAGMARLLVVIISGRASAVWGIVAVSTMLILYRPSLRFMQVVAGIGMSSCSASDLPDRLELVSVL